MTGGTDARHPGEHAGQNDSEHTALDKDDVKGCFAGTFLIGCLAVGAIVGGLLLLMALMMSLAVSQDPGYRNGGRNPTDRPMSETSP